MPGPQKWPGNHSKEGPHRNKRGSLTSFTRDPSAIPPVLSHSCCLQAGGGGLSFNLPSCRYLRVWEQQRTCSPRWKCPSPWQPPWPQSPHQFRAPGLKEPWCDICFSVLGTNSLKEAAGPVIPATLEGEEGSQFEVSLGDLSRPCLRRKSKKRLGVAHWQSVCKTQASNFSTVMRT